LPRRLRLTVAGRGSSIVTLDGVWPAYNRGRCAVIARQWSVRVEQDFGDIGDVLSSQFFETFDLRL